MGSLFDGAGTFPFAGIQCGVRPVWASEIAPFPVAVTSKRIPDMKHLGDITKIDGAQIEPVDIIITTSPCQDMSVAGKRQGIEGERSGLFFESTRIIKEMRGKTNGQYPRFAVWENVPGAFTSNGGEDFRAVLEEFCKIKADNTVVPRPPKRDGKSRWNDAGVILGNDFSVAWRVFDAQFWGVPSAAEESSLWRILEVDAPRKYYLSAKACRGILRRASNRGKAMSELLVSALNQQIAAMENTQAT